MIQQISAGDVMTDRQGNKLKIIDCENDMIVEIVEPHGIQIAKTLCHRFPVPLFRGAVKPKGDDWEGYECPELKIAGYWRLIR